MEQNVFADPTQIFVTGQFLDRILPDIEERVTAKMLPADIRVVMENDDQVKITGNDFTVSCSRVLGDIFVVQIAGSKKTLEFLGGFHTLEFVHKELTKQFAYHDALAQMFKDATLVEGDTVFSAEHGMPIALIAAGEVDRNHALRRTQLVEAQFADDLPLLVSSSFLQQLKRAFETSGVEGVSFDRGEFDILRWSTGELRFNWQGDDLFVVSYLTLPDLSTHWSKSSKAEVLINVLGGDYLPAMLPDQEIPNALIESVKHVSLAVGRTEESPSFYILAATYDEVVAIAEKFMNTHTTNSNNDKSTVDSINEAANAAGEAIAGAADTVGQAGADAAEAVVEALQPGSWVDECKHYWKQNRGAILVTGGAMFVGSLVGGVLGVKIGNALSDR